MDSGHHELGSMRCHNLYWYQSGSETPLRISNEWLPFYVEYPIWASRLFTCRFVKIISPESVEWPSKLCSPKRTLIVQRLSEQDLSDWLKWVSLFVGCEQCSVTEHFSKKQNSARFSVKIIAWKCLEIFDHNVNLTLWDSQTIYTELTTGL